MRRYLQYISILVLSGLCFSCSTILDVDSDVVLSDEDNYLIPDQIYASFVGIAQTVQACASQAVVIPELKSDLLEPTNNAPEHFWKIHRHLATVETEYCSSRPFYDVVINTNDFLTNLFNYTEKNPGNMPKAIEEGLVSAAINYKVWATFMIGKLYGEAVFYHSDLSNGADTSQYQTYTINQLLTVLLDYMVKGEKGINAFNTIDWKSIMVSTDELPEWSTTVIPGQILQGELYLWDKQYKNAIDALMLYISRPDLEATYKVTNKFKGEKWEQLFIEPINIIKEEIITTAPFDRTLAQKHTLQEMFSAIYPNKYYLSPTKVSITDFESQKGQGVIGDMYRGVDVGYREEESMTVVSKYHLDPDKDAWARDADIPLYRAAEVHLMLSEAYVFLGEYDGAMAFVNDGLNAFYDGASTSFRPPFVGVHYSMSNNIGIRNRASLDYHDLSKILSPSMTRQDSIRAVSELIVDEVALELAYEGKRWFTLMRMARNLDEPEFLAKKVSRKFKEEGEYNHFLSNMNNWFIK